MVVYRLCVICWLFIGYVLVIYCYVLVMCWFCCLIDMCICRVCIGYVVDSCYLLVMCCLCTGFVSVMYVVMYLICVGYILAMYWLCIGYVSVLYW